MQITAPGALESEAMSRPAGRGCELTILMPCLNEAETIATCIRKAQGFLQRSDVAGEILIADNGSTDGSPGMAQKLGVRVIAVANRGYGSALMAGIRAARGRFVIMADADDSYDFAALQPLLDALRAGCDLVMGNRFKGEIAPGAMPLLHRYLGNPLLTGLGRLFFRSPIGDFHCGLRGFRRDAIVRLRLSHSGMEFASEMVVKATLHGLRIGEVPIRLSPDGRSRAPHLRRWRDGWRHLRFLLLFSPRWLFLYPGAALTLLGLVGMVWLLPAARTVGGVTFDVNTLAFAAAALICGFQALTFALFSKVYAIRARLLPEDPRVTAAGQLFRMEFGLLAGLALMLTGLGISLYAVGAWSATSFEDLDPQVSLRYVIPAVTALVLGLEIILSSFFYSILLLAGSAWLPSR